MRIWLLTFVCFLSCFNTYGQKQNYRDSLEVLLHNSTGQEKLRLLIQLSYFSEGQFEQVEESLNYAAQAKELARSLNNKIQGIKALLLQGVALSEQNNSGVDSIKKALNMSLLTNNDTLKAEAHMSLGLELHNQDNYQSAINNFNSSLQYFNTLKDTLRVSFIYNNLGRSYFQAGDMVEALANYQASLALKKKLNDQDEIATAFNNLAIVYKGLENFEKALLYNQKSIKIQQAKKDTFSLSFSYLNTGNIYRQLKKYDSAILQHNLALEMSQSLQDTIGVAYAYYNLGSTYYDKRNLKKSEDNYLKALRIFQKAEAKSLVMSSMNSLSIVYRESGDINNATKFALDALEVAEELKRIGTYKELLNTLYNLYKIKNDYQTALEYHEKFVAYSDGLLNQQKLEDIAKLETNFEISQRDSEIKLLNKVNELNELELEQSKRNRVLFIILGLLLLSIIVAIYRSYQLKKQSENELSLKNESLEELNAAKDKFFAIIAHDLRSPLSAFKSLSTGLSENFKHLSEKELQRYLENLKDSSEELVNLLQNLLQWALSQTKSLQPKRELLDLNEILEKNIQLLEESADQKNIEIDLDLSSSRHVYADAPTIDLVFRNLISNAIKFTEPGGKVIIKTSPDNDKMEVAIEDNGIGMTESDTKKLFNITEDTSKIGHSKEKGTGLGLILCKEFIDKNEGEIFVKSTLGLGSTFNVILPRQKINSAA